MKTASIHIRISARLRALENKAFARYPALARTHMHWVLYFSLAYGFAAFMAGCFYPLDLYRLSEIGSGLERIQWIGRYIGLAAALVFLLVWRKKIRQGEKEVFFRNDAWKDGLLYGAGVWLLWLAACMFPLGMNLNIAHFSIKHEKPLQTLLLRNNFFLPHYFPGAVTEKWRHIDRYFNDCDTLMRHFIDAALFEKQVYTRFNYTYDNIQKAGEKEYCFNDDEGIKRSRQPGEGVQQYIDDNLRHYYMRRFLCHVSAPESLQAISDSLYRMAGRGARCNWNGLFPELRLDNYRSFCTNSMLPELPHDKLDEVLVHSDPMLTRLLFDDFLRNIAFERLFIARRNFIQALDEAELDRYCQLLMQIDNYTNSVVPLEICEYFFGVPHENNFFAFDGHILAEQQAYEQERRESNRRFGHRPERSDTSAQHRIETLVRQAFTTDSLALCADYQHFAAGLSDEPARWHRAYLQLLSDNISALMNFERYRDFSIPGADSLLFKYPLNRRDSIAFLQRTTDHRLVYAEARIFQQFSDYVSSLIPVDQGYDLGYQPREFAQVFQELMLRETTGKFSKDSTNCRVSVHPPRYDPADRYSRFALQATQLEALYNRLDTTERALLRYYPTCQFRPMLTINEKKLGRLTAPDSRYNFEYDLRSYYQFNRMDGFRKLPENDSLVYIYYADYLKADQTLLNRHLVQTALVPYLTNLLLTYRMNDLASKWPPGEVAEAAKLLRENGFAISEGKSPLTAALFFYSGSVLEGFRRVQLAKTYLSRFHAIEIFQQHILALLVFVAALFFFLTTFETGVVAYPVSVAIILQYALDKLLVSGLVSDVLAKQTLMTLVMVLPAALGFVWLLLVRRSLRAPVFLFQTTIVFVLLTLLFQGNVYLGEHLTGGIGGMLEKYERYALLLLAAGLPVFIGTILLRRKRTTP